MFSKLTHAVAAIGGAAIMLVLTLVYWFGLPLLNDRTSIDLPLIGEFKASSIPVLGPLVVGHLQTRIDLAVEDATKSMVSAVQLKAAEAELEEMERKRNATAQALEEYRRRYDAEQSLAKANEVERDKERMAYEIRLNMAKRRCTLDDDDIDFLQRRYRGQAQ